MPSVLSPFDLQAQSLRAYTVLEALRPCEALRAEPGRDGWAGSLILNVGLDAAGSAVSFAANVAGAVCLTIEPDVALCRTALRTGACDFVVNTLDEALRAIKNEVRKHNPLSVGLEGGVARVLDEAVERGLAPQLFTAPDAYPGQAAALQSYGAHLLSFSAPASSLLSAAHLLDEFLAARPWRLESFAFATSAALRAFDSAAAAMLPPEDTLRRRWLAAAPRLFPRDRARSLWVTAEEASRLRLAASS